MYLGVQFTDLFALF